MQFLFSSGQFPPDDGGNETLLAILTMKSLHFQGIWPHYVYLHVVQGGFAL
jgi:hypothetical protein